MEEQRTELKKYYKEVKVCKICGKLYGTDFDNENYKDICIVCFGIHKNKIRRLHKYAAELNELNELNNV